jgi:hypothetical protein
MEIADAGELLADFIVFWFFLVGCGLLPLMIAWWAFAP